MARYAIVTEIKTEANEVEWWMDQTDSVEFLRIFDSFEEAKKEMRTAIRIIAKASKFFPLKGDKYEPIEKYYGSIEESSEYGVDIKRLGEIVSNTIRREDYFCEEPDLDIRDTDDSDWHFAFVANKNLVHVEYYVNYYVKTLKMNVHNMTDPQKQYYFDYTECDEEGRVINSISVGLYRE